MGDPRMSDGQDLIAGTDAGCLERRSDRASSAIDEKNVPDTEVALEGVFKISISPGIMRLCAGRIDNSASAEKARSSTRTPV